MKLTHSQPDWFIFCFPTLKSTHDETTGSVAFQNLLFKEIHQTMSVENITKEWVAESIGEPW